MEALNLPNTIVEAVDVTDREAFGEAIRKAEERFGPVDCLVNNAGVMLLGQIVDQNPEGAGSKCMRICMSSSNALSDRVLWSFALC